MTADLIVIWTGIFGLAYLAGAGFYFGRDSSGTRDRAPASHDLDRHTRLQPVRIRRSR